MPEPHLYRTTPMDDVTVYSCDHKALGYLVQKALSRDGDIRYGILEVAVSHGTILVPVPWSLLQLDTRVDGYVTSVSRFQLLEAPHLKYLDTRGFDDAFARRVDAAYGMEFPDIETLNDFA